MQENKGDSIDVILTAYKRPDILSQQLEAIHSQTVRPRKIFLYQDGIDSYYQIHFKQEFLDRFDGRYIAEENYGVWKRFEYAERVSSAAYVCIFDDDTIPGTRWLENCLCHMKKEKAVYGTNGVLIKNHEDYPDKTSMRNVGWNDPNETPTEVDFVGHSWFLDRTWIPDMVKTEFRNKYKYAGEDMYLSYICQKKGIKTIVPPHPCASPELWGSIPRYGYQYGITNLALSANSKNQSLMNQAMKELRNVGWKFVTDRDETYIDKIERDSQENVLRTEKYIASDLQKIIDSDLPVYLYGAGLYGKYFYDYLSARGKKPQAFVVSDFNTGANTGIEDIPVIDVNTLFQKNIKMATVIIALNEFYHDAVRERLEGHETITVFPRRGFGYPYERIIDYIRKI